LLLFIPQAESRLGSGPGPGVDTLQYLRVPDSSAAFAAVLNGELDMTILTAKADLDTARAAGLKIVTAPSYMIWMHHFNLMRPIISDVNFRRAIAHLIPKQYLIDQYSGETAEYASGFLLDTGPFYNNRLPDNTYYDPEVAALILDNAGYVKGADGWRINPATGEKIPELQLVTWPEYWPAALTFVEQLEVEMEDIGIPARIEMVAFTGGVWYSKIMIQRDFDLFFCNILPGVVGEGLYSYYGAGAVLPISKYNNSDFDAQWAIYSNTLNQTTAIDACWKMQEILANDMPGIPCFTLRAAVAMNPDITGFFGWEQYGYPSTNAILRWRWKDGDGGIQIANIDEPGSFIQGYDTAGIVGTYTWWTCDVLLDVNPLNQQFQPWIVSKYTAEPWSDPASGVANGSKYSLWLADNLYWHDGVKFTAYDIEFALKYSRDYAIPKVAMRTFFKVEVANETRLDIYFNATSFLTLAAFHDPELLSYPKHLYNPNATIYGEPEGPMGLQYEGQPGVPDPSKFAAVYIKHPNPPADKPWLTCFIGVGPWIFKSYELGVGSTFVANRNYFKTVLYSDTNFDMVVNILDITRAAKAFGASAGNPRFDLLSDMNGDDVINIVDLTKIAINFAKKY
jgi:ABC-type transport system substrate-binding protein